MPYIGVFLAYSGGMRHLRTSSRFQVSETRLALLSNQDVGLDIPNVNVRVNQLLRSAYRSDAAVCNFQGVKIHKALARLRELLWV